MNYCERHKDAIVPSQYTSWNVFIIGLVRTIGVWIASGYTTWLYNVNTRLPPRVLLPTAATAITQYIAILHPIQANGSLGPNHQYTCIYKNCTYSAVASGHN